MSSRQSRQVSPMEIRVTRSVMKKHNSTMIDSPNQKISTPKSNRRTRKRKQEDIEVPKDDKQLLTDKKTKRIKVINEKEADNSPKPRSKKLRGPLSKQKNFEDSPSSSEVDNSFINRKNIPDKHLANKHTPKNETTSDVDSFIIVTPKSSPIPINLSPNRSRKTPRKSPVGSTSPKTHAALSVKLSKTPRKLPVTITDTSPMTSDNVIIPKLVMEETPDISSVSKRLSSISSSTKKKEKTSSAKSKTFVPKFAKSPKIVIRLPKRKSRKLKGPLSKRKLVKDSSSSGEVVSPKMPTPAKSLSLNANTTRSSSKRTPHRKTLHSYTENVLAAKTAGLKSTCDLSPTYVKIILNQPKIVLERLDLSKYEKPMNDMRNKLKTSTISKSPYVSKSNTPLQPMPTLESSTFMKDCNELFIDSNRYNARIDSNRYSPRSKIKRTLNWSPNSTGRGSPKTPSSPFHIKMKRGNSEASTSFCMDSIDQIENESEPSMYKTFSDNTSFVNTSTNGSFYKANNKSKDNEKNGNTTYELLEPKTPDLRQRSRKRTSVEAELDHTEPCAKRHHKVQFASPKYDKSLSNKKYTPRSIILPRSNKCAQMRASMSAQKMETTTKQEHSKTNVSTMIPRRRLDSGPNTITQKIITSLKRRSNSLGVVNSPSKQNKKTSQFSTISVFDSPLSTAIGKKLDGDKPKQTLSARKAPNFAQIHEKKFAKMESVVDAKKRVAERHKALMAKKAIFKQMKSNKSPRPTDATNNGYNRFGYKIRKEEAKNVVSMKEPLNKKRKENQKEQRSILKDVRLNKRFELHMKARNINI